MKIAFASDYRSGSNPDAIYSRMVGNHSLVYRCTRSGMNHDEQITYDIAVTNNRRCLQQTNFKPNSKGSLTVHTHHGQGFLGDAGPEAGVDICLAASEHEKAMYVRNGYDPKDVFVTGRPRVDALYAGRVDRDETRLVFLEHKKLDPRKKTVLYSPTWDRAAFGAGTKGFFARWVRRDEEVEVTQALLHGVRAMGCNLVIRLHGHYARNFGDKLVPDHIHEILGDQSDVAITSMATDPDSIPTLIASDVMITDLSSIAFDYLALNRPIIFIDPWEGWHYAPPGKWYCNLNDRPGAPVEHIDELVREIGVSLNHPELWSKVRQNASDLYLGFSDGKNSERAAEVILNEYSRRIQ